MGVAIALSGDHYYYWMYSDCCPLEEGPCSGLFRVEGDFLYLAQPTSLTTGKEAEPKSLYSYNWRIIRRPTSVALHSASDKPEDVGRSLILDVQFDPENPFRNQDSLKPEQGIPPNDR